MGGGADCPDIGRRRQRERDVVVLGSGELFDAAIVRRLYPGGAADYLERFTASLDAAIQSGFILAADREEILQLAATMFPSADA